MFKKIISFLILVFIFSSVTSGQEIIAPIVKVKSHPTLEIDKIILTKDSTVFFMSIKNKLDSGGYFCVNRDVFINAPGSQLKYDMIKSTGIESCPKVHKFKYAGETVSFRLTFPPLPSSFKEVDMIENCDDNCFYLKGIVLDQQLNDEMKIFEKAIMLFREGKKKQAVNQFKYITDNSKYIKEKHYTYSLYIVPLLYYELGDYEAAKSAYYKIKNSDIEQKEYFINRLKSNEFFNSIK